MKPTRHRSPSIAFVRHCKEYELDVRREAEALVEQGIHCDVLYLGQAGSPLIQSEGGVTLRRLPGGKTRGGGVRYVAEYCAFLIVAGVVLTALHLRHRYRAIQINTMPDFLVFAALIPKLMGTPVVVFMQEPTPELAASLGAGTKTVRVLKVLEQRAIGFADHAITVTEQLRARYIKRGADPSRVSVVLNGPDPEHIAPRLLDAPPVVKDGETFTILCHGTIEDRYGHDTLVDAAAIAVKELPSLRLVITGRGGGVEAMLARIAELNLNNFVNYEGWVSDERLAELLSQADVGVVGQKASPYSHLVHTNKMYDYWIAGLPVIASRLEATSADFDDETIAFFDPSDPVDLARQLVRVGSSTELRSRLAEAGRRAYELVGWHAQKERYLDIYRDLIPDVFDNSLSGGARDRATDD